MPSSTRAELLASGIVCRPACSAPAPFVVKDTTCAPAGAGTTNPSTQQAVKARRTTAVTVALDACRRPSSTHCEPATTPSIEGDWEAVFQAAPPDFELETADRAINAGTYRGRDEVKRFFEDLFEPFDEVLVEPEKFLENGDLIVVLVRVRSRPSGSSAVVDNRIAHLWTVQDGTIVRLQVFPERRQGARSRGAVGAGRLHSGGRTMSNNVELVRMAVDAVNRHDLATLDAMASDEFEFHSTFAASEGRAFRGREGVRDYFDTLDEVFDDMRIEIEEITDAGEDRLVVVVRVTGRGKGSGASVEQRNGQVWRFANRKIVRIDSY